MPTAPSRPPFLPLLALLVALCAPTGAHAGEGPFAAFESPPVRPAALSPAGDRLFVVNTPGSHLEIFAVDGSGLTHETSVPVGLEPVAVAVRNTGEVWVVNHLSDSVSIVDVASTPPRVVRTLLVGDEPSDLVFAGPSDEGAFITTAHRGQNHPIDPEPFTEEVGRADVWIFDTTDLGAGLGGIPETILSMFGDSPRALARSADGATVYAAVFHSGSRTTTVPAYAVCDGGQGAAPCAVGPLTIPGGVPAPNQNLDGVPGPETGLIVKFDPGSGMWLDELSRDWSGAVPYGLPDEDVFVIDADAAVPVETAAVTDVGTVLFGMAVHPTTGAVYVANTDAINHVRLESNVNGHHHETRISIVPAGGGAPVSRRLNKHIDYGVVPSPPGVADASLAIPTAIAVDAAGANLFVAAFGSSKVGFFSTAEIDSDAFTPSAADHAEVTGGGPSGIVVDDARGRLYVPTRFDNGVSVVDIATKTEIAHHVFHNPEPDVVIEGRPFLYDARETSSNGEASCAGCHVFGDVDGLAWDLGDVFGPVLTNPLPTVLPNPIPPGLAKDFHPLKGPMRTQTLRGMATHGPMHWRGDRTGAFDPGGTYDDERAAFDQFNPAFVGLMGRNTQLDQADMDAFTDFILEVVLGPNPYRNLDNSLTAAQQTSRDFFTQPGACSTCHEVDPAAGFFGTGTRSSVMAEFVQFMKVPQLRTVYRQIGRYKGVLSSMNSGTPTSGDEIRGFGFNHDGSTEMVTEGGLEFLMVLDSDFAPIVGQQVTYSAATAAVAGPRIDLLLARAAAGECDVVVKGVVAGEDRGYYRMPSGEFQGDRAGDALVAEATLRAEGLVAGQELTYTCTPPEHGVRMGVDRDFDGVFDRDELDVGTDPTDETSRPYHDSFVFRKAKATSGSAKFESLGPIALTDALGSSGYLARKLQTLGAPSDTGNGIADPETHLTEYRLLPAPGFPRFEKTSDVGVTTACSDVTVQLKKASTLLVPTSTDANAPTTEPLEGEHDLDHFLCYLAKVQSKSSAGAPLPKFQKGAQVDVDDGTTRRTYDLVKIQKLCVPTEKSGSPIFLSGPNAGQPAPITPATVRRPDEHLLCYKAKLAKKKIEQQGCGALVPGDRGAAFSPKQVAAAPPKGLHVADQFGQGQLDQSKLQEICLPASVERAL